jgi:hypothetical protein
MSGFLSGLDSFMTTVIIRKDLIIKYYRHLNFENK